MSSILYHEGEVIAIRNTSAHFFLADLTETLETGATYACIRWWTNVDHSKMNEKITKSTGLQKQYRDRVLASTILSNVPDIVRHSDETISIKQRDIDGIKAVLRQSLKAECTDENNHESDISSAEDQLLNVCHFHLLK